MLPDQRISVYPLRHPSIYSQRTLWYVSLLSLFCHFTSLSMKRYNSKPSLIFSKKHANVQSLKNLSQRKQQFSVIAEPVAAVLNGDTGSTINNTLVKDQPIFLDLFCQSNFLARLMAIKEIGQCQCYAVPLGGHSAHSKYSLSWSDNSASAALLSLRRNHGPCIQFYRCG